MLCPLYQLPQMAVSAQYANQQIQVRVDGLTGPLLGVLRPASTGSWDNFVAESTAIQSVTGVHTVYLVCAGTYGVANLDWFTFLTGGVIAAVVILILTTFRDYGISWDEMVQDV